MTDLEHVTRVVLSSHVLLFHECFVQSANILTHVFQVNKKTRNRAYDILVQIGHACLDDNKGGKMEYLYHLFNMVLQFFFRVISLVISHLNNINGLSSPPRPFLPLSILLN